MAFERASRRLTALVLAILALGLWIWGNFAIRYSNLPGETLPKLASWVFTFGSLGLFLFLRSLWRAVIIFLGIGFVVLIWWLLIPASQERPWTEDLERLVRAEVAGDKVTIHNIRNFEWTSSLTHKKAYYTETFDLQKLSEVDLILSYWDEVRAIAHTIVSFGFEDGKRVAISIEVRRELGEDYDPFEGMFKQYELSYVVANELDVIKLRTNRRGEEVYLYPSMATNEQGRALFLDYMERINELAERPEFYHTVFNNCTTNIVDHVNRVMPSPIPYGQKILLNGYSDEIAYERGWLDQSKSYSELRARHNITERAKAAENDPNCSERIREFPPDAK